MTYQLYYFLKHTARFLSDLFSALYYFISHIYIIDLPGHTQTLNFYSKRRQIAPPPVSFNIQLSIFILLFNLNLINKLLSVCCFLYCAYTLYLPLVKYPLHLKHPPDHLHILDQFLIFVLFTVQFLQSLSPFFLNVL